MITGTLGYDEPHKMTADARAVVLLIDVTAGPDDGTVIASTSIKNPGPQPVKFHLAYPFSVVKADDDYRVYAGIVDGDSAWATPTGVSVDVPQPEIAGLKLQLEYRPDLLKGAVSGTITGVGLDSASDPESYGTSLLLDVNTGATIGFQLISPAGAAPIPYSVPFDPSTITPGAAYVARGSVWDGTTLWNTPAGVPVITNDNPKSNVLLTVVPAVTPTPAPEPDSGISWALLLLITLVIIAIIVAYAYWRSKRTPPIVPPVTPGPIAPPPPPGPDPTEPPPPPDASSEPDPELAALVGGTAAVAGAEAAAGGEAAAGEEAAEAEAGAEPEAAAADGRG